jgi:hypothetical protein
MQATKGARVGAWWTGQQAGKKGTWGGEKKAGFEMTLRTRLELYKEKKFNGLLLYGLGSPAYRPHPHAQI